ncbi:thioredoxin domain-containing protein [Tersicoccus sp. MR15.9]|uniref:thioredoxin domain-containing protein n=1 Tax=Tersicoccus mangrovi TaxID=3121635 RepID=UPI002FE663E4
MNRLAGSASTYLRQHADNPVDWWPWGPEAFAAAAERDVPVLVSIGYAACHWCHVMAAESFADANVAAYLNANFVAVKVDREEHPDVDAMYMAATQALTGEGGWPMTVFTDADGRCFYAGTYFPPRPVAGRPSFSQLLVAVQEAWAQRRSELEATAESLAASLGRAQAINRDLIGQLSITGDATTATGSLLRPGVLAEAVEALAATEDTEHGGFGGAPKFPGTPLLSFLARYASTGTSADGGDAAETAEDLLAHQLTAMASSALYDQVEGGFARYSVTADWSLPHFEKMLYDNAQLMQVYLQWSRLGARHRHEGYLGARIAEETGEWMIRELALPGGGFASSLDADTELAGDHFEGLTYVWTPAQLADVVGDDAEDVAVLFNVGTGPQPTEYGWPLHPRLELNREEWALFEAVRPALRRARRARPQPGRDEKVVAAWNGMAVAALSEASLALDRPDFADAAVRAADYLWRVHVDETSGAPVLARMSAGGAGAAGSDGFSGAAGSSGAAGAEGQLEDYAQCVIGFLSLFSATGDDRWYERATALLNAALDRFVVDGALQDVPPGDGDGVSDGPAALAGEAPVDPLDGAVPSGTAALALACALASAYSGSTEHRSVAEQLIGYVGRLAVQAPQVVGAGLAAATVLAAGPTQIAVVGQDSAMRSALRKVAAVHPAPALVLAVGDGTVSARESRVPLLRGRPTGPGGVARAYVCRTMVCDLPAETEALLRTQLGR